MSGSMATLNRSVICTLPLIEVKLTPGRNGCTRPKSWDRMPSPEKKLPVAVVKSLTQGQGVDVVLDLIGTQYFAKNLDVLGVEGRLVQIATQSGIKAEINLLTVMQKRLHIYLKPHEAELRIEEIRLFLLESIRGIPQRTTPSNASLR